MKKTALFAATALLAAFAAGCAKFPENTVPITGKLVIVTMTVAGQINPNYHYYLAFDTSGTPSPGALPVVGPPWGNGWGTGNITNYVVYDQLQPQGGYAVFQITPNTNLLGSVYIGPPISSVLPPTGSNKLQFTISTDQLATLALPASQIDLVNINFITTDVIPLSPDYPGPKYYDGLGERGNSFITISFKTSQRYTNSQTNIERTGDCPIPDLDITDWSVEIQGT